MFLRQLLEDIEYDDVKYFYENDRGFTYLSGLYTFTDLDQEYFNNMKFSTGEFKKYSLDVITVKRDGLMPRVYLSDHEDELVGIRGVSYTDLSCYSVDSEYSKDTRRKYNLICFILLENTFYRYEEERFNNRNDLKKLGAIELSSVTEIID